MGLAGRKQKQRIPADPRNLSWADDASRFGLSYLSKFGWDASQGLGSSGDGMKTHLKVQQKLDMMGIGAQHQQDPNGIAWKQNKDFEALLKRLNESTEHGMGSDREDAEGEDVRVHKTAIDEAFVHAREKGDGMLANESSLTTKKRKQEDGNDPDASENAKKKRKKEKKEKRQKPSPDDDVVHATSEPSSALSSSKPHSEPIPKSRPMAHRARIRAAKRIAGKSASAIAEILGIAPSTSVSSSTATPASTPPPSSTLAPQPSFLLNNLTISTKSVADYFKEKLFARSSSLSSPVSSSEPSGSATPSLGATGPGPGFSLPDDEGKLPRRGIGHRAPVVPLSSQVPEAGSTPSGGDSNVDGRDILTGKQCRKAERKAEKRKQREVEASQASSKGMSTNVIEQLEEGDTERAQRMPKKEKKRRERKEQTFAHQANDNDDDTEKRHGHDTPSGPLPKTKRKTKKEHKKDEH